MSAEPLTVDELERWALFGGRWRVAELNGEHATVELRQCTGELVERRTAEDAELIARLRASPESD